MPYSRTVAYELAVMQEEVHVCAESRRGQTTSTRLSFPGNSSDKKLDAFGNYKKGLSFITNRQRRNEGTFSASELAGIEPTPPAPKGAGYVRLHHSATGDIQLL
jgi:hypothetical protein